MINISNNSNKYKINEKISLYKDNLMKFISCQNISSQILQPNLIEHIDYIVGILFLTETNRYCKLNKISAHGYYLAYTFINIFNKLRKIICKSDNKKNLFGINDILHYIISLSKNIDYLNSRTNSTNIVRLNINSNIFKFQIEMIELLSDLIESVQIKIHTETIYSYYTTIFAKFFYLLLETAKFFGSGIYNEPNLKRLGEYYSIIFYTLFNENNENYVEIYDNYLNYKNKLNYSLIELNLNSETLDEIIKYLDDRIVENLCIK